MTTQNQDNEPCKTIVRKILIDPAELERLRNVEKAADALREALDGIKNACEVAEDSVGFDIYEHVNCVAYDCEQAIAAYDAAQEGVEK
jgi:hypothetical protein